MPRYGAEYNATSETSGRSSVVRMPGGAAITAGMAFTMRPAAPAMAAWLWSPLLLVGQMSTAYDGSPVISTR